jgi:hypothetical protein
MNQTEILDLLTYRCTSNGFHQISSPLPYQDQELLMFALANWEEEYHFFGFEIVSSVDFLANPAAKTKAYKDPVFFDRMTHEIDLSPLIHEGSDAPNCKFGFYKIVPDEPACRMMVKTLWNSDQNAAARVILVSRDGTWLTGKDMLGISVLLS